MEKNYEHFKKLMDNQNKEESVRFIYKLLKEGNYSVKDIYENFLRKTMYEIECTEVNKTLCVWKEHVRTSIIRTIIENCYLYIQSQKENIVTDKSIAMICPDGEYHELGARMASDFFQLCGFESTYVGSSTPREEFMGVINTLKPDYIAISVTNVYNLFSAKKTISQIRQKTDYKIYVIAGGSAFGHKKDSYREIGADYLLNSYQEIRNFSEKVAKR